MPSCQFHPTNPATETLEMEVLNTVKKTDAAGRVVGMETKPEKRMVRVCKVEVGKAKETPESKRHREEVLSLRAEVQELKNLVAQALKAKPSA